MEPSKESQDQARHTGVSVSPDFFEVNDLKPDGWEDNPDLRAAVVWLTSFVKPDDWKNRRLAALRHFLNAVHGHSADPTGKGRFFNQQDLFAWYLFLGWGFLEHPLVYDFMYGSRVVPVLAAIGRNLELLKGVEGVNSRVQRMVGPEKAQVNACLFELLVAAAYRRAGASVTLLEERPGVAKTHDMDVTLNGTTWAVECKRMEAGEFSEQERQHARNLWIPVSRHFVQLGINVLAQADFLVELKAVPPHYMATKARQWMSAGALAPLTWSDEISVGSIKRLDLRPLQKVLKTDNVTPYSSKMLTLLLGQYTRSPNVLTELSYKISKSNPGVAPTVPDTDSRLV